MNLSASILEKIETIIAAYPVKRSCILPLLHLIQEEHQHISKEAMEWVAQKLELSPMQVYEVVSFYPMFKEAPLGKTHIKVCRTLSCALKGSHETCKSFQKALDCKLDQTSKDGSFSIEFVECLADCNNAPVVQINEQIYPSCTPEKAFDLAQSLKSS